MKTLSATAEKNNTKKTSSRIEAAVEALTAAVMADLPSDADFGEFEKVLLETSNEVDRRILSNRLERIARRYDMEFLLIDGNRYKELDRAGWRVERMTHLRARMQTQALGACREISSATVHSQYTGFYDDPKKKKPSR